ncbi:MULTISPECIES: nuclear transport factor 2 family protein [Micromonospora]|uniref:SnoaL-like domain-containing protein n=1 Tax=Micromonospora yangpuensis TaxID=683228 RepID=A0A1C6URR1_9ACTN|nr:nuclear transport factor 2 family protein [Micromonospora yangpuensis]GGM06548.1 hypothetical protein GCM10012279_25560 [Micromonospora yangpuensis]SCL56804.1 hypothetical protein GA0070617_3347 [Micromonospora yangpuensis]
MTTSNRRALLLSASIATGAALGLSTTASPGHAGPPGTPDGSPGGGRGRGREERNRQLVMAAFARQNSGGSFYDILADDVRWSIVNGRTYDSRAEFLAEGSAPILDRLRTILRMRPLQVWTDGDTVIVHFEADAVALDGLAYHNEYCWILRMRANQVFRVHAFLDMVAVANLVDRVKLPAGR